MMPLRINVPQRALVLDHARIGQEFLEITPHRRRVGGVRRAEIDQEHADLAGHAPDGGALAAKRGGRYAVGIVAKRRSSRFIQMARSSIPTIAATSGLRAKHALTTLSAPKLTCSATRRLPLPRLVASPCLSCRIVPAAAETARVTFVLVNDIYLMGDA